MKQIATALVKAQKSFGPALKSSTNPHFRSKYADLSACVEAVIDVDIAAGHLVVLYLQAAGTRFVFYKRNRRL